jgi:HAD superfamily hydrolase (TIGR01509 family)
VSAGDHDVHAPDDTRLAADTVPGVSSPLRGPLELVIFDCDGVLVDSESIAAELEVEMFAEIGMPMTADEIRARFLGRSAAYTNAAIVEHLGALPDGWEARWERRYYEALRRQLRPIDGVAEALDRIVEPVCVASSSRRTSIALKLELCGLADRFGDRVFSAEQVTHGKPAPDLFLFAAQQLGVDPSRCAVVEDSPVGVLAARAARMLTFAYTGDAMVPREALEGAGTTVFGDMHELPDLLAAATRPEG